jgi:hypothetical protein
VATAVTVARAANGIKSRRISAGPAGKNTRARFLFAEAVAAPG